MGADNRVMKYALYEAYNVLTQSGYIGSYPADVGQHHSLYPQSNLWGLIYRPQKGGQMSWLLACG